VYAWHRFSDDCASTVFLPPDGTIVVAMTATHFDDDRESRRVMGPLVTWWVEALGYWLTVVAGETVEQSTIRMVRDDERLAADDRTR